jgi:uncharacterized protein (TIGR02246 family)
MKSVKLIALIVTILSLLVVPLAWSQGGNAEQQIKQLVDQHIAALIKADTNSLEKLLADDCIIIRGDGSLSTKTQEIENIKAGAVKTERIDLQDLKIRVYGHTAIATALSTFKGTTPSGTPVSSTLRNTRIWVKQKGNWKLVSMQATRLSQ